MTVYEQRKELKTKEKGEERKVFALGAAVTPDTLTFNKNAPTVAAVQSS